MTAIFDRIQKLHAMAESAAGVGNAEEAAIFAAKVQDMLDRHRLDSSILESSEPVEEVEQVELDGNDFGYRKGGKNRVSWFYVLVRGLCDVNGCQIMTLGGTKMIIIGAKSDREIVQYLSAVLIREMERLLSSWKREQIGTRYAPTRRDCNSWRVGFVYGIKNRLKVQREEFLQDNTNALVVINRHAVAVDELMNAIPHSKRKLRSMVTSRGYDAGKDAAATASFYKGTGSGAAQRALKE